jgi:hypothetical protein
MEDALENKKVNRTQFYLLYILFLIPYFPLFYPYVSLFSIPTFFHKRFESASKIYMENKSVKMLRPRDMGKIAIQKSVYLSLSGMCTKLFYKDTRDGPQSGLCIFWGVKYIRKYIQLKEPYCLQDKDNSVVEGFHLAELRKISPLGLHKKNIF